MSADGCVAAATPGMGDAWWPSPELSVLLCCCVPSARLEGGEQAKWCSWAGCGRRGRTACGVGPAKQHFPACLLASGLICLQHATELAAAGPAVCSHSFMPSFAAAWLLRG